MRTVSETPLFKRYADDVWTEEERLAFISFIAVNPEAGDVIPGSGGCRKIRWSRQGQGKRGGVRVIYFNQVQEVIWLLILFTKTKLDDLPSPFLARLKKEVEDAN